MRSALIALTLIWLSGLLVAFLLALCAAARRPAPVALRRSMDWPMAESDEDEPSFAETSGEATNYFVHPRRSAPDPDWPRADDYAKRF